MTTRQRALILIATALMAATLLICGGTVGMSNQEVLGWVGQQTPTMVAP